MTQSSIRVIAIQAGTILAEQFAWLERMVVPIACVIFVIFAATVVLFFTAVREGWGAVKCLIVLFYLALTTWILSENEYVSVPLGSTACASIFALYLFRVLKEPRGVRIAPDRDLLDGSYSKRSRQGGPLEEPVARLVLNHDFTFAAFDLPAAWFMEFSPGQPSITGVGTWAVVKEAGRYFVKCVLPAGAHEQDRVWDRLRLVILKRRFDGASYCLAREPFATDHPVLEKDATLP